MLKYSPSLKSNARRLRKEMTDTERILWSRLRGKQILHIQFYRQKPVGSYIVDFYAPKAKVVIEVDGSQHIIKEKQELRDIQRDAYLKSQKIDVLRFNNFQILQEINSVMEVIYKFIERNLGIKSPFNPPFSKGENKG